MNTSLGLAVLIGTAFGAALEQAGLGNARKLVGQFYLTDFTVFKVMFSAILTAMLGIFWLARLSFIDLSALYVPETFVVPQLAGGLLFGLGFVLSGLCPGTSCVAAASGRGDGLATMFGLFIGVTACGLAFAYLEPFYKSTAYGALTLPQLLGLPYGVIVFAIVAIALVIFRLLEKLEPST
ncbi:sulfurtransferase [Pseudolysobacter antarcticus]|uniref:Sulfurtransferase n=1 Tax=Pseudolysobacter antarcticus TaxID=2511995 RepID=A0A411HKM8_9GAMM|nr:YeeE/YedE thiosulfate transporter family protein [Pseudolysobacter antarcticus]QBB71086.1 sulfurtransferase [Pseudolysobacter antarcticus]